MDFSALVFGVEAARRSAQSALPHAEVVPHAGRWRRAAAAARRVKVARPRPPQSPYE
jgi:hypothetical protein